MEKVFIGYHGTTRENGKNIIAMKYFHYSVGEKEWLGTGVYFFEDDIIQAKNFCVKARKYDEWMIIKSEIKATKVIDLINSEHLAEFRTIANKIRNRYKKQSDGRPRELLNSVVLNIMYRANPYEIVRACFVVPKANRIYGTNISPMQIQLCVRDRCCIKSYEEVS